MEVCFLSGASLALAQDKFKGKTAKAVKQALVVQMFRLVLPDSGNESSPNMVLRSRMMRFFACTPVKLHMVVLDFYPADAQRSQQAFSASMENNLIALEQFLHSPSNPNFADEHGYEPLHYVARNRHVESMLLFARGKCRQRSSGQSGCNTLEHCSSEWPS